MIAAKLAEARSADEFAERAQQLRDNLLAMTRFDVVFGRQPWLAALDGTPFGDAVRSFIVDRRRPPLPDDPAVAPAAERGAPAQRRRHHRLLGLTESLVHLSRAGSEVSGHASSLLTLEPIGAALRGGGATGITPLDVDRVTRPGLDLRLAVVALGAGYLRYVCGDGRLVESDGVTPVAGDGCGPVPLIEGVLASASVPMIFPPRSLADDVYVDGGVLQNVPIQAAVSLGAERIVAVLAVPLHPPPDDTDWTTANLLNVYVRAAGAIPFLAQQRHDLATPMPPEASLTAVVPTVDVVGPFEVAQGLMLLDMDYGWLRAAEAFADLDEPVRRRAMSCTDHAVAAREHAWYLEEDLWAGEAPPDALDRLREFKDAVREALAEREALGLATPPDAGRWWQGYEVHAGDRPDALPATLAD